MSHSYTPVSQFSAFSSLIGLRVAPGPRRGSIDRKDRCCCCHSHLDEDGYGNVTCLIAERCRHAVSSYLCQLPAPAPLQAPAPQCSRHTTGNRLTEPRRSTSNADPLEAEPASVRLVDSFASSVRQRVPGTLADNSRHSRHSFPGLTLSLAVRKRGTLSSSQGPTPCRKLPMPTHASITLRLPFHTAHLSDARLAPFRPISASDR